jgi:hypothetical protein
LPRLLEGGEPAPAAPAASRVNVAGAQATQPVSPTTPPTLAPAAPPRPQPTALPTAAPPPNAPGRVLLDERFADNQRGWPEAPQNQATLSGGAYLITARQPGQFVALGVPLPEVPSDLVIGASFHKVSGPAGGGFGLILRDQGPDGRDGVSQAGRYYVFEIGDKGEVGVWRRETDHWVDLVPWQPSSAVRAGTAANEMLVRAVGSQFSLTVNGTPVASPADPVLPSGRLGVFVGGDLNQVAVDHLWVQTP